MEDEGEEGMMDEIDRFHANRDRLSDDGEEDEDDEEDGEEVLRVREDDQEEDDGEEEDDEEEDSDVSSERIEPESLSSREWGRTRSAYYNTGYIDADYGGMSGSDVDDAELEEEEARQVQAAANAAASARDYGLLEDTQPATGDSHKFLVTPSHEATTESDSTSSLALILDEYEEKTRLRPFRAAISPSSSGDSRRFPLIAQLSRSYQIYNSYLLHLLFYVRLSKAASARPERDPASTALTREVLAQLAKLRKLVAIVDHFLHSSETILTHLSGKLAKGESIQKYLTSELKQEKVPAMEARTEQMEDHDQQEGEIPGDSKRAITYQIAKNKTSKRKNQLGHSRLKKREQFRKALVKRRSQVGDVRRELDPYGGERRGIKPGVVRSIKLRA